LVFAWVHAIKDAKEYSSALRKQNLKIANLRKDFNWLLDELEMRTEQGEDVSAAAPKKKVLTKADFMSMSEEEAMQWLQDNHEVVEALSNELG
jgi:uncharacterized protein YktB (UPF0637 family)